MVAGYEIFVSGSAPESAGTAPRAVHEEAERALDSFKEALIQVGFLPVDNPEARFVEWREIFGRAGLTPRETRVLLALGRRVQNTAAIARRARESRDNADPDGT
jgi:tRNA C32,U32 (ribose-2'-O)-methylase TrmJ